MKKNSVRLICIVLSALLIMAALPVMSFAGSDYKVYLSDGTAIQINEGQTPTDTRIVNKIYWERENQYSAYQLVLDGFNGTAVTCTGDLYIRVKSNSTLTGGVLAIGATGSYGACVSSSGNISISMYNGATLTLKPDAAKAAKQHIAGIYSKGKVTVNNSAGKVVIDATNSSNGSCYGIYGNLVVNAAKLDITATSTNANAINCYGVSGTVNYQGSASTVIRVKPGSAKSNAAVNGQVTYEQSFTGATAFINGDDATKTDGTNPALTAKPTYNSALSTTAILRYGAYNYSAFGVSKNASTGSTSAINEVKICEDLASVRPQVGKPLAATVEHDDYILRLSWSNGHGGFFKAGTIATEGVAYQCNAYFVPLNAIQMNETASYYISNWNTTSSSIAKYAWMFNLLGFNSGNLSSSQLTQAKDGTSIKAEYKQATAGKEPTINPANPEIILSENEKVTLTVYAENCVATVWEKKVPGSDNWDTYKAGGLYTTADYTPSGNFNGTVFRISAYAPGYAPATTEITVKEKNTIKISKQPTSVMYADGKADFSVAATGKYELSYQWYYETANGTVYAVSGQTGPTKFEGMKTDTLKITTGAAFMATQGYKFYCVITDKTGAELKSDKAIVLAPATITIKEQPANAVIKDKTVTFKVTAESTAPMTYQWYMGTTALENKTYSTGFTVSGATTGNLTIKNVIPYLKSVEFYCVIKNSNGTKVETNKVSITSEIHAITIKEQPVSVTAQAGNTVTFKVTVDTDEAAQPVSYQWYKNGTAVANSPTGTTSNTVMGATGATLSILYATADFFNGAEFYVVATNADGEKVTSAKVKATITAAPAVTVKTGDVDNDGDVTVSDARLALRASIGLTGDKDKDGKALDFTNKDNREYKAADVDGEGGIKVGDARLILRVAVRLDTFKA